MELRTYVLGFGIALVILKIFFMVKKRREGY